MRARSLLLCAGVALLAEARAAAAPAVSRDQIIDIAKSGVGCPYVWGGTCWDPNNKTWKGADCSGFLTKCWQIPTATATTDCVPHYYSSSTFVSSSSEWQSISRDDMDRGDAFVRNGHVILYEGGDKWGAAQVYEARGAAYGIVYRTASIDSSYSARRRNNLVAPGPPPPPPNAEPQGSVEVADCKVISGWAQDPDAKASAIDVHIYFDGSPGQPGAKLFPVKANRPRPDLCAMLGSCAHAFELATPVQLKDGKPHTVRAYAIDSAGGTNPELSQSSRTIVCAPPAIVPPPAAAPPDAGVLPASDLLYTTRPDSSFELPLEETDGGLLFGGCGVARAGQGASLPGAALVLVALLLLASRTRRQDPRPPTAVPTENRRPD